MLVTRWQAPIIPNQQQIMSLLEAEGLDPIVEEFNPQQKITEHRHPFTEIRYIVSGEMLFSIAGNQFLMRPGDRVEVPSNTKHWHSVNGSSPCICITAQRVF
ncbi:MAG: hypothetical protein BroJett040_18050 [Oligoflexia bacterium]|nr:MAG: hypothetical protein BroJett040_18050 [Oligoflexia bacterium]